jgi:hypothetical protein
MLARKLLPRKLIGLLAAAGFAGAVVGCSSTTDNSMPSERLAAYAASTQYPNTQAQRAGDIGVIVEPSSKMIRILNFGQKAVNDSEIWLNGTFVYRVDTIPGEGYISLREADFFDHSGHSFADTEATPTKIELRNGDHVWTLLGPIVQ